MVNGELNKKSILLNSKLRHLNLAPARIYTNHKPPRWLNLPDLFPHSKILTNQRPPDLSVNRIDNTARSQLLNISLICQGLADRVTPVDLQIRVADWTEKRRYLEAIDRFRKFSAEFGEAFGCHCRLLNGGEGQERDEIGDSSC